MPGGWGPPGCVDCPALEAVTPFPPPAPSGGGANPSLDRLGEGRDHEATVPDTPAAVTGRFGSGHLPPAGGSLDGGALGIDRVPRGGPIRQPHRVVPSAPEVDADQLPGLGARRRTGRRGAVPEGTPPLWTPSRAHPWGTNGRSAAQIGRWSGPNRMPAVWAAALNRGGSGGVCGANTGVTPRAWVNVPRASPSKAASPMTRARRQPVPA
jgi:hypothetical protein